MSETGKRELAVGRRQFLQTAGAVGAAGSAAAAVLAKPAKSKAADANSRLRIGFIGVGKRGQGAHVAALCQLHEQGSPVDLVAVCDVYRIHREQAAARIRSKCGHEPAQYVDYRDMIAKENLDAVCIGTPDHWHALQTTDSLKAGLHVYCEKPMTHTLEEALDVVAAWKASGRVMQVGVQATSMPIWNRVREMIDAGKLGKVLQWQTQWARNSIGGMSRHNVITAEMTPDNIDWRRFLGVDEGLAPMMTFDRATYGQWRCLWQFGYGMLSDLFVHRVTSMLKATGLRYPARVVGAGGIFLEYDGREVMDVATLAADFREGVQGLVSSTMVAEEIPIQDVIRGHHGAMLFSGKVFNGVQAVDFVPERPQVTLDSNLKREIFEWETVKDQHLDHMANFVEAVLAGAPERVNNPPDLGAAAVAIVNLAVRSYREGKVFHMNPDTAEVREGDGSWAAGWEKMSRDRAKPRHVPGWHAGDKGSLLVPPEYQKLAGPWIDGRDPAS